MWAVSRGKWVESHLEETEDTDTLVLPEEVPSLNVDGYVAHPLFALVVMVEYTIRCAVGGSRLSSSQHAPGLGGSLRRSIAP